jgi:hypothetical protein
MQRCGVAALALLLAACATAAPPGGKPSIRNDGGAAQQSSASGLPVVRQVQSCADIRGGISGFVVFALADGSGREVAYAYGNGSGGPFGPEPGPWFVAEVQLGEATLPMEGGWPNECEPATYAGHVTWLSPGYDDEAAARRAAPARPR